jgi:hypothetical protein
MFLKWSARPALTLSMVLAGTAAALGGWLWLAHSGSLQILLGATLLAGCAIAAILGWDLHARTWRRWQDAVDAYADREIAQALRTKTSKTVRAMHKRAAGAQVPKVRETFSARQTRSA